MPKTIIGRPKVAKELKKVPVTVSLPQWLKDWLDEQPEAAGMYIENGLRSHYKIIPPPPKDRTFD